MERAPADPARWYKFVSAAILAPPTANDERGYVMVHQVCRRTSGFGHYCREAQRWASGATRELCPDTGEKSRDTWWRVSVQCRRFMPMACRSEAGVDEVRIAAWACDGVSRLCRGSGRERCLGSRLRTGWQKGYMLGQGPFGLKGVE